MNDVALHSIDFISVCTGGAGLDRAVELVLPTARSVCMVEREAFAVARLVEEMHDGRLAPAPVWPDVRTFRGRPWRGLVDGLIGGIPCQPHSLAGERLGDEDERDLWSPTRRIIVASGVWLVIIENVEGMLSAKPNQIPGAERVWRDLHRLGFTVEGGLYTAGQAGLPHERPRVFIVGVHDGRFAGVGQADPRDQRPQGDQLSISPRTIHRQPPSGSASELCGARVQEELADALGGLSDRRAGEPWWRSPERVAPGWAGAGGDVFPPGADEFDRWTAIMVDRPDLAPAIPRLRKLADGMANSRVDELRLYGNGVVPVVGAYALRGVLASLARKSAGAAWLVRAMNP